MMRKKRVANDGDAMMMVGIEDAFTTFFSFG
jgi:hypothetical protein